jgi:excisionase family DNA binding protein
MNRNRIQNNCGLQYAAFVEGEFLSKRGAASLIGSCVRSIERRIAEGKLKSYRFGRSVKVRRSELLKLMGVNLESESISA